MSVHLGFDMGIRNLAYCLMRHSDLSGANTWKILAWDNVDLLEGGASAQSARCCFGCGHKKPEYADTSHKWCRACATRTKVRKSAVAAPSLPALPCAVSVKTLRGLAVGVGFEGGKKMKKEELVLWATERYLMPWKPAKTMSAGLDTILAALDTWLDSMLPTLKAATLIRLENQPVMKGPTMKSVQMILFTLLSHRLRREHNWLGSIEFVHAGVKSRGAEVSTDISGAAAAAPAAAPAPAAVNEGAAYRARKRDATTDTLEHLEKNSGASQWLAMFKERTKKSDLADAFLMALRGRG